MEDLPPTTEVFVIRTKRLWEDWIDVNNLLGSTKPVTIPDKDSEGGKVNARGTLPIRNNLSKDGQEIVCHFLKEDIRVYVDLMNRAVNLSDDDVREALAGVQKNCPTVVESLATGTSVIRETNQNVAGGTNQ